MGREARFRRAQGAQQPNVPPQGGSIGVTMGPAGLMEFTTFVGATADGPLHDPQGSPGKYSAVLTMSRPGVRPLREYEQTPSDALEGDSHIAIAKPAFAPPGNPDATEIRMTGATGEVVFSGLPNRRGFLAGFKVYPFEADNFADAYAKGYARVAPTLSVWSMHLDVPLHVFQIDILEIASGNRMIGYVNPAAELPLAVPPGRNEDADLEALASIYREAQNSNSLLYQFLCFYKIAEALRRRRDRLAKAAARGGAPYTAPVEVVPSKQEEAERWLGAIFPVPPPKDEPFRTIYYEAYLPAEGRGRSFEELLGFDRGERKGILTEVRDLVAHALSSSERGQPFELVNLDDRLFHRKVHIWLPLMKVVARRMLKTDFPGQFLAHLPDPEAIDAAPNATAVSEIQALGGGTESRTHPRETPALPSLPIISR